MTTRSATLAAATLLLLVMLPTGASDGMVHTANYHLELAGDAWAAIRFNVTPGSDLAIGRHIEGCTGEGFGARPVLATAAWLSRDGRAQLYHLNSGSRSQVLGADDEVVSVSEMGSATVAGTQVHTPSYHARSICEGANAGNLCLTCRFGALESVVAVMAATGAETSFTFDARWTKGVVSYDIASGPLRAYNRGTFGEGAQASVYPISGPTLGAAVLAREVVETRGDTIGYVASFDQFSNGVTHWSCTQNGVECSGPRTVGETMNVHSTGPTTWDFRMDRDASVSDHPYYFVALIELPDDTWID